MSNLNPLDWSTVQPVVDALLAEELTPDSVEPWLAKWSNLAAHLYEAGAQVYRDTSENTADEEAEKRFLHFVEEIEPAATTAQQALKEKLLAVEGYTPSRDLQQLMKRFRSEAALFREENVPLNTELAKLGNEYDKIIGGLTVEWEGETLTMPQAKQKLQNGKDAETRERLYRLILDRYLQEREALNALYLKMLAIRRQIAKNAGMDSFRSYTWQQLGRFDYTPEDCFIFHDAIEHSVVPLARRFYQAQRDELGVDTLQPWNSPWEAKLDASGPPLEPFSDADELEEGCARIFERVDPALAEHFAVMRNGYLDLASRANKAPGGYCNEFPVARKPYIFMNAVGTHDDVTTLLHEGGHAFHVMESQHNPLLWQHNGPMEFCEVASMAMELLSAPYYAKDEGGFYSEGDAKRALTKQLESAVLFLPYMAVVDAFQHWVYTEAPEDVTTEQLDAKWSELYDRFMPEEDYSGLQAQKETGWHRKGHIFGVPFYYVEYGLAQMGAFQVWRNALRDQAQAVADYRKGLALGDTRPLPELFEAAGARFAFDREMVGGLMDLVSEQLDAIA